jgi:alanine-alpha-ketoisovalerate/valine-pyruvate aminotransferase
MGCNRIPVIANLEALVTTFTSLVGLKYLNVGGLAKALLSSLKELHALSNRVNRPFFCPLSIPLSKLVSGHVIQAY